MHFGIIYVSFRCKTFTTPFDEYPPSPPYPTTDTLDFKIELID